MIKITYSTKTAIVEDWQDTLTNLVIGHKLIEDKVSVPVLVHGKEKYEGEEAINKYIDSLANHTESWFACACD